MHATILKGIVGGFEFTVLPRNLKELAGKAMKMCLRVLMERKKCRFDSFSRQEQCIDHIPYYLSGFVACTFFQTTFLKIAINVTPMFSHIPIRKAHDKSNPEELPK